MKFLNCIVDTFRNLLARPTSELTVEGFPRIEFPEDKTNTNIYKFDELLNNWNTSSLRAAELRSAKQTEADTCLMDDILQDDNVVYPDGYITGNPPAPNWYYTKVVFNGKEDVYYTKLPRWWNGKVWSIYCRETDSAKTAGECAKQPSSYSNDEILWKEIVL